MYSECFRYNGLLWERETICTQSSQWAPVLWSKKSKILFGPVNSNFHFKDWYKSMALQWTNSNKDYGENSVWFPKQNCVRNCNSGTCPLFNLNMHKRNTRPSQVRKVWLQWFSRVMMFNATFNNISTGN
jgi:hypothetical protein